MQETWVQSLGWEDTMEKGKATPPVFWLGEFHLSDFHFTINRYPKVTVQFLFTQDLVLISSLPKSNQFLDIILFFHFNNSLEL